MIINNTSYKIRISLESSVGTQLPFSVSYTNYKSNSLSATTNNGTTNDTSYVDLVPSPQINEQNELRYCSVVNSNSAMTFVQISFFDGTNNFRIFRASLDPDSLLQYQIQKGWEVIDNAGNKKTMAAATFRNTINANNIFRPSSLSSQLAIGSINQTQNWYFESMGRIEKDYSSVDVMYRVTQALAGTITSAELGVYSATWCHTQASGFVFGRRAGVTNISGTSNSLGVKKTNIITTGLSEGDNAQLVWQNQVNTTVMALRSTAQSDSTATHDAGNSIVGGGRPSLVYNGGYITAAPTTHILFFWKGN